MDLIEILINGDLADYRESDSLPVSLEIKTDEFFKLGTTAGTRIDNPARQLIFPGTIANQTIFDKLAGIASASIRINGSPIFTGKALHKITQRKRESLTGFSAKLLGGARDLFSELGGKTLRSLDLGQIDFTDPIIQASWVGSYDSGDKVVFAPVFYGATTGGGTNDFDPGDLRPHVYFPAILEALWDWLEVKVESQFFDTDFFKRFVFLFGVGDAWEVGGLDADDFDAWSQNTIIDQIIPLTGLNVPMTAISDPGSVWGGSSATLSAGDWTFEVEAPSSITNGSIYFEIPGIFTQVLTPGQSYTFGPITVASPTTAALRLYPFNAGNNVVMNPAARLKGKKISAPALGGIIDVASCLPGDKITSFLAGISHLFNLVWHYNPILRVLTVEPRFDYKIGATTYPGFYKIMGFTGDDDWTEKFDTGSYTQGPTDNPFGDYVDLNNQAEDSEQYKRARAQTSSDGTSYLGARYQFDSQGRSGTTDHNPYFENLLQFGYGAPLNLYWMPRVAPDPEDGVDIEDVPPTFETTGPKYAYYHGFEAAWSSWSYNGSNPGGYPVLYQKPRDAPFPIPEISASYSDYIGSNGPIPGLASIFYPQYLATINRGEALEGEISLRFSDVQPGPELFRNRKRIELNQTVKVWIFLGVKNFQPLKNERSKALFIQPVEVTLEDVGRLISSAQKHYLDD